METELVLISHAAGMCAREELSLMVLCRVNGASTPTADSLNKVPRGNSYTQPGHRRDRSKHEFATALDDILAVAI